MNDALAKNDLHAGTKRLKIVTLRILYKNPVKTSLKFQKEETVNIMDYKKIRFQAQSDIDHHRNRTERRSLAKDIKTTESQTPCLALRVEVYYYYNATRHGPAVEAFMVLITTSLFQLYISSPLVVQTATAF